MARGIATGIVARGIITTLFSDSTKHTSLLYRTSAFELLLHKLFTASRIFRIFTTLKSIPSIGSNDVSRKFLVTSECFRLSLSAFNPAVISFRLAFSAARFSFFSGQILSMLLSRPSRPNILVHFEVIKPCLKCP